MYNPRGDSTNPSQLYNPNANTNLATAFPGDGPKVATNAITVNVKYNTNSQLVTWTLAKETEQDTWVPWFRSGRGMDGTLQSQTFDDLSAGWWRFQLEDPQATSRAATDQPAIQWMSLMAPRGNNPWARDAGFSKPIYDVYFRINEVGIVAEVKGDPGT